MIEHVEARTASEWYEWACRRARASKRRTEKHSTELPEFAPPVALSDGPLGAVQAADREIARQTADAGACGRGVRRLAPGVGAIAPRVSQGR